MEIMEMKKKSGGRKTKIMFAPNASPTKDSPFEEIGPPAKSEITIKAHTHKR